MSVRIRLNRIGKKHVPFGRIVAIDSRKSREGSSLADLGTYDFLKSRIVSFNEEEFNYWISVGAQPSDSVKKIVSVFKKQQKKAPVEEPKKVVTPKVESKKSEPEVEKSV